MDSSAPNSFAPPPPGLNYIEAIRPSVTMLMIGSVWSAVLVPLLCVLFFFSTKDLRRKPIFILNVCSILLGIAMGLLNGVKAILTPLVPQPESNFITFASLVVAIPIFVESILVLRLMAVYPWKTTPLATHLAIFTPLFLLKIARVTNAIVFIVQYKSLAQGVNNPIASGQKSWRTEPGQKIEWFLQVVDNSVTSGLFLLRLQGGKKLAGMSGRVQSGSKLSSYSRRLKGLFWISVSNFVFPVFLSLCQLIFIFRDPDYLKGTYIFLTNDYVEIVGVLLATVWQAGTHWADDNSAPRSTVSSLPTVRFRSAATSREQTGANSIASMPTRVDDASEIAMDKIYPQRSEEKMAISWPGKNSASAKAI
ncbi:hypothetical protein BDN71DRAFT_1404265 [Pleurotus eryngii]|uniref:Uncharacterized protein n=1 Tax=Pleurotus eryngii TaxID=5323 RepID=A0A9P5ZHY9_PLEER|nr:hypothetical protein BDN71DRAFT_1404265 [Pleurotus eryngii]